MTRHIAVVARSAVATLAALLLISAACAADTLDHPVILVATPDLHDQLFGASVVIVTPIGNRQHIGFIVNRPMSMKLSEMFPDHEPSRKIIQPIYLGGPENINVLFAVVKRHDPSGGSGIKLTNGLYLEMNRKRVDDVIESEPEQARFYAGVVVWEPGELAAEIANQFWYVEDVSADIVLRKSTTGMWEELIKRIERNKHAITAGRTGIAVHPDLH